MFNSDNMTKAEFLGHMHALYRAMNYADSNDERKADWMDHQMAGWAGCVHLDHMLHDLKRIKVISPEEFQQFHDEM